MEQPFKTYFGQALETDIQNGHYPAWLFSTTWSAAS